MSEETVELDYLEDAQGPGVVVIPEDVDLRAPAEEEAEEQPEVLPGWDQETIEQFLRGTGAGIHMLAGKAEKDWLMTEQDLARIGPPLTRIANRYEAIVRLSPMADPLLVAHGVVLYGWRSTLEARRAQRDAEEEALAAPGYDHGPAPVPDEPLEESSTQPRYFPEGDSHA